MPSTVADEQSTIATQRTDYDSPWKEIIELYFEQFVAFFFPKAHIDIDWSRGYEFLDKELQQVVREAETGRAVVDKLVKVWLNDGEETWLLIHIEVQSQAKADFAERMFTYNYRLFDRYQKVVVSFAVLADAQPTWHPRSYRYGRWGSSMRFIFATAKLLDYNKDWPALEQNSNPFAVVVMAHLKAQATHRQWADRLRWKINLLKQLYDRGYSRQDVLELLRFIDWILVLPAELEESFQEEIQRYEKERNMQYVTSWERRWIAQGVEQGIEQGIEQAIIDILETRFVTVPTTLIEHIQRFQDHDELRHLLKQAVLVDSLETFSQLVMVPQN